MLLWIVYQWTATQGLCGLFFSLDIGKSICLIIYSTFQDLYAFWFLNHRTYIFYLRFPRVMWQLGTGPLLANFFLLSHTDCLGVGDWMAFWHTGSFGEWKKHMPERKREPLQTGSACECLSYKLPPPKLLSRLNDMSSKPRTTKRGIEGRTAQGKPDQKNSKMASLNREACHSGCAWLCSVKFPSLSPEPSYLPVLGKVSADLKCKIVCNGDLQSIYPLHSWHLLLFLYWPSVWTLQYTGVKWAGAIE